MSKKRDIDAKVMKLLSLGFGYNDIAERLGISEDEVKEIVINVAREWKEDVDKGVPVEVISANWGVPSLTVDSVVKKLAKGDLLSVMEKTKKGDANSDKQNKTDVGERRRGRRTVESKTRMDGDSMDIDDEYDEEEEEEEFEEPPSAAILRRMLEKSHVPKKTIDLIMMFYNDDYEHYENNPMALYNLLTGLDIKPNRAKLIVEKFLNIVHGYNEEPQSVSIPFKVNGGEDDGYMIKPRRQFMFSDGESVKDVKRSLRDALDVMLYSTILKQISSIQGSMSGQYPPNPFVSTTIEPIIIDGKVATDQYGMPMYRITYNPIVNYSKEREQEKYHDKDKTAELTIFKELFNIQRDFFGKLMELNEKKYKELEEQINYALRRDPIEETANKIDLLRRAGLISSNSGNSKDIEFEKWKFEQEMKLRQMEMERNDKWRERKMSQENMKMIVDSLRDAIATIGKPLALAVGSGIAGGVGLTKKKTPIGTSVQETVRQDGYVNDVQEDRDTSGVGQQ
ncbi:MAG: hypothetical protein QXZ17_01975 [Nitrososphaerota archaeon]